MEAIGIEKIFAPITFMQAHLQCKEIAEVPPEVFEGTTAKVTKRIVLDHPESDEDIFLDFIMGDDGVWSCAAPFGFSEGERFTSAHLPKPGGTCQVTYARDPSTNSPYGILAVSRIAVDGSILYSNDLNELQRYHQDRLSPM